MSLARHVNAEGILKQSHDHSQAHQRTDIQSLLQRESGQQRTHPRYEVDPIPKYSLPAKGIDSESAYQLIHDELELDGRPLLNLASFVHTWMDPAADKLMAENVSKNLIDSDEYPSTTNIHTRCISILASLWHADEKKNATGTATTGSSEAIQLAGLAMKKNWQARMKEMGKDEYRPGPNIVMGANAQVALEKFARYFDVEMRLVPVDASTNYCLSATRAMEYVDENTIGIFVILGSTYTGHYEPVEEMAKLLDEYEAKTGISVPIHVDGASGGFVAPFATPALKWDFRIPRVVSINTSGHKFGLAYVGVGWVIWRDSKSLPKDLVFELHYLGSVEYSFSLNFSRPAAPIIAQYFNFVHLGFEKYREITIRDAKNARFLSRALENSTYYEVVSNIHKPAKGNSQLTTKGSNLSDDIAFYDPGLPVVAFKFSALFKETYPHIKQHWIQTLLRSKAWIVPNYELPPNVENEEILRVVVRERFTEDLVEKLVTDIIEVTEELMADSQSGIFGADGYNRRNEKRMGSHGEGVRASGHDSVC